MPDMKKQIAAMCLAACVLSTGARADEALIAGEPLHQMLPRVKHEVGLYQNESASWHASGRPITAVTG
jgi:hypothetical protein